MVDQQVKVQCLADMLIVRYSKYKVYPNFCNLMIVDNEGEHSGCKKEITKATSSDIWIDS